MEIKKFIIRVSAILFIFALFTATWGALRYLTTDDTQSITRTQLHEFYAQDQIDTLLLGASHCYVGLNPAVLDQELECYSFNLGSSAQTMDITWLLMREAVERYDIRHIYVDLSYNIATFTQDKAKSLVRTYIITDYMKPSIRKTVFLLTKSGEGNYVNSFLIARRNWETLFNFNAVSTLLEMKRSPDYKSYIFPGNTNVKYVGKGFVEDDRQVLDGSFIESNSFFLPSVDLTKIDPEWDSMVKKMISFCDQHSIALTFISLPISSYILMTYGDYDLFIDHIRGIIEESGSNAEYYDFNLMKEEYWKDTSRYFYEYTHLNSYGAEVFNNLFCSFIRGDLAESDLFYPSFKEKYMAMEPSFYGLFRNNEEGGETEYHLIANHPDRLRYQVFSNEGGQESAHLRGWCDDPVFYLSSDYEGECRIQVSVDGDMSNIQEYTLDLEKSYITVER